MDDSNFGVFPNEIMMKILGKVDTVVLERVCSRVCNRWREISETLIQKRLDKIRAIIPEAVWKEINLRVSPNASNMLRLKEYERTFISPRVDLRYSRMCVFKLP